MPEIDFNCSRCGQALAAPGNTAGLVVECPACHDIITVPEISSPAKAGKTEPTANPNPKSSTIRIDLPPNLGLPPAAPKRRIVIRRSP